MLNQPERLGAQGAFAALVDGVDGDHRRRYERADHECSPAAG
ncbi:hypothetical protein [Streptomyces sp. NPDC059176]